MRCVGRYSSVVNNLECGRWEAARNGSSAPRRWAAMVWLRLSGGLFLRMCVGVQLDDAAAASMLGACEEVPRIKVK